MSEQQKQWDGPDIPAQKTTHTFWLYFILVVICGSALMLGFCGYIDTSRTQEGMKREITAIHMFDYGASEDAGISMNKRAEFWGKLTSYIVPAVSEEKVTGMFSVVDEESVAATGMTAQAWWNRRMKVNLGNFLPVLFVRLEMIVFTFILFMCTWPIAYYLGQRYARLSKREGKAVGDNRFQWTFSLTKILFFGVWVLPFCPLVPPVAYWLVPAYLVCWTCLAWLRRNSIEV